MTKEQDPNQPLWALTFVEETSHENESVLEGSLDEAEAQIVLPCGDIERGHYQEKRRIAKSMWAKWFGLWVSKEPEMLANGFGVFTSDSGRFSYEGYFSESQFHDHEGDSQYTLHERTRYTGRFRQGKRHGAGKLERYSLGLSSFYLYFEGQWKDNKEWRGNFYSNNGRIRCSIDRGVSLVNITTTYIEAQSFRKGILGYKFLLPSSSNYSSFDPPVYLPVLLFFFILLVFLLFFCVPLLFLLAAL